MGTVSFIYKFAGMKKEQEFDVYPIDKNSNEKIIVIQSDKRIGRINLENGKVYLSKPHSGGAYFLHLSIDVLSESILHAEDLNILKSAIIKTAGELAGDNGIVYCDNSKANLI